MNKETSESSFKSKDNHRIYYQTWKAKKPKGVLIFVHGLNEHSGRYQNPINHFVKAGYTLYLLDQRGHGKSDGPRSFIADFNSFLEDLDQFTKLVAKKEAGLPLFMVGHSMGGQIVLNYVGKYNPPLKGFLTSSANIQMAIRVSAIKKKLGLLAAKIIPSFSLLNEVDPKWISRDPEVVRAYKKDPLVSKKLTLSLASAILRNQEKLMGLASKIKLPAFLMHSGDDHICAAEGSQKFFEQLASKDKQIKIYEGFYHELFNEFGKETVFEDMEKWLNARVA